MSVASCQVLSPATPRRRRPVGLVTLAIVVFAIVSSSTSPIAGSSLAGAAEVAPAQTVALPVTGALFGTNAPIGRQGAASSLESVLAWETMVGRKAAVVRTFYRWGEAFPTEFETWLRDGGRTPIVSWGVSTNEVTIVPLAEIAAGAHDAEIDARAQAVREYGTPLFLTFEHEPEGAGTAEDFVAAWRRVHDRFEAAGVTNVTWVLTLMAFSYRNGEADSYYPGDDYVDMLGADGYNWNGCPGRPDPWLTFEQVFQGFYDYGVTKGKPMVVAEWASMEDPAVPGRKAAWIDDAADTLRAWPEVKAVSWFETSAEGSCPWWIDTSTSSLDAYKAMATSSYFNPPPPLVTITSGPPPIDTATSTVVRFAASIPNSTFTCSLDGVASSACSSPHSVTGLADGGHALAVTALAPNGGAPGTTLYRWTVDTVAPVLTLTGAPPPSTAGTGAVFFLTSTEPGIFMCQLDGGVQAECAPRAEYSSLADGSHTFSAVARDEAGNQSSAQVVSWRIDTRAPVATVTAGPPPLTNSKSATLSFGSDETGSTFKCSRDGGSYLVCSSPKTYYSFGNGSHTLDVVAFDAAMNASAPARWSWTVDATRPTVTITSGPTGLLSGASFTFSISEPGTSMSCRLDAAPASACLSPVTYSPIGAGTHNFYVYATDTAGNVGPTARWTWRQT